MQPHRLILPVNDNASYHHQATCVRVCVCARVCVCVCVCVGHQHWQRSESRLLVLLRLLRLAMNPQMPPTVCLQGCGMLHMRSLWELKPSKPPQRQCRPPVAHPRKVLLHAPLSSCSRVVTADAAAPVSVPVYPRLTFVGGGGGGDDSRGRSL